MLGWDIYYSISYEYENPISKNSWVPLSVLANYCFILPLTYTSSNLYMLNLACKKSTYYDLNCVWYFKSLLYHEIHSCENLLNLKFYLRLLLGNTYYTIKPVCSCKSADSTIPIIFQKRNPGKFQRKIKEWSFWKLISPIF